MPKRIPTPPPADDEPRYLTVVHPYAINGTCNMELPKDRRDFANWVACCINKDAFFAIFHKPSSRGMVIIEIMRDYPHFDRILGEHRWSEFLQSPKKEERDRTTQVFYCTYNTGRIVQKNGWKRIDVDEAWFKAWSPKNQQIKFPYPQTHFCDVPVEDMTNHPLCRPLPGAVKAPVVEVIAAPQPVVGSAAWIKAKEGGPSPAPAAIQGKSSTVGAWGKGASKAQATAKPIPSVKKHDGTPQGPHIAARMPAVGGGPVVVKTSNVWQNKGKTLPVPTSWDDPAPVSGQSTPISRAISPVTAPTAPPRLPVQRDAWESGAASYPTQLPGLAVPGESASAVQHGPDPASNWDSPGASTSSPDSDSGPDLVTTTESDNPYNVHVHFSESMEEEFHGMRIKAIENEDEEDDENLKELDSIAPGAWGGPIDTAAWETAAAGVWDDDALEAEDLWRQNQEPTVEPTLCKAHGIICKRGICAEYTKQVRLARLAEEAEKRKAAAANRGKKGNRSKGRGASRRNDEDQNQDGSTRRNAMQNNPFRGPGAPVKTNWRGAPRAIVSADTIEQRETTKTVSDDEWGNSDLEAEPNAAAVVPASTADADEDAASDSSWGIPESAYNPWATTAQPAQPVAKANRPGGKPQGKKKPGQTRASSSWADQVDAELRTAPSKRGPKRGTSTTSGGTSAKSSVSGWGTVSDMPW